MNKTSKGKIAIGAPNSIARFVSDNEWGKNKWAVLEQINGKVVVRAAQTTESGARSFLVPGCILLNLETLKAEYISSELSQP